MAKKVNRLFEQFVPEHYDLLLDIDSEGLAFKGSVVIKGRKVGRPSKRLTFHQNGLKISSASVKRYDKKESTTITLDRINKQDSLDELRLHSDSLIYPGLYEVSIDFEGSIDEQLHGIYPTNFKHGGKDKRLIVTQFESHHAREAFPCIDEPEAKATFDLTLVSSKGVSVLANTPIKSQKTLKERISVSFETSPKMSTYLLAFVVGEIHGISGQTKNGVKVSSWSTVAQPKEHLKYANAEAIKILEFFEDYFKTPFPLKKLDNVALPDFEAGAMENWGLITYREVLLLADPINRSLSGEQVITEVIAHEVSHQWFGNLVTMKWWDDLWLNESFATLMEIVAPDKLHPDWQMFEDFAVGRVLSCSHRDIYKDVQPVGVVVKHPDEIMSLFDPAIVYAKGARLLSMLHEYLGEDSFRSGLEAYFKKHSYSNTTRHDLWQAFDDSGKSIDELMTPWIEQSGQPELSVKKTKAGLKLSQKRFLLDGEDNETTWPIPLLADKALDLKFLDSKSQEVDYDDAAVPLFNVNGSGHYIVDYEDEDVRAAQLKKLVDRSVSSISRITLLNDAYLLSRDGEYKLVDMLEIISQCDKEPRDAVWSMFSRLIGQAEVLTDGDLEIETKIKAYKRDLAQYWYNKLGWDNKPQDDPNTKHLRSTALALSLSGKVKPAIDEALKRFKLAGNVEKLKADQRSVIAIAVVRYGSAKDYDQLMTEYVDSPNPDVQQAIAVALCSVRDEKLARKLINWGLKEGGAVRPQDISHFYAFLMRNYYTRDLAWQWLVDNWGRLHKMFAAGKYMEYFIWYTSGPLSTPEWQARFNEFFKPKESEVALQRNIQIAYSEIDARVAWRKRENAKLKQFFNGIS